MQYGSRLHNHVRYLFTMQKKRNLSQTEKKRKTLWEKTPLQKREKLKMLTSKKLKEGGLLKTP